LNKIKEDHKPIRLKEISKFARKMEKIKSKRMKEKQRELKKRLQEQSERFNPVKYLTKFQKRYLEQEKVRKLEAQAREREKLELVKRQKKFAKIVSVTHQPRISEK
jgi:hypothetical protein